MFSRAIRLTLQVWMDTYIEDFKDPPLFSTLHQVLDFAKEYLPGSDLLIKVKYKIDKLKKAEELKSKSILIKIRCDFYELLHLIYFKLKYRRFLI